jgi:hypothetical protein
MPRLMTRGLRMIYLYDKTSCMENIRPEVKTFLRSCEHLFGFTHESEKLTPEECQVLEYYVEELHKQIAPHCTNSQAHCQENAVSS